MRRTARNVVILAALASLAAFGCGEENKPASPNGGNGTGGIDIVTGGTGGGDPGGTGGTGGEGGIGGSGGGETGSFEITAIHPSYGPVDGGTRVTIKGKGFVTSVPDEALGASTVVIFGDNPSIDARVVDDQTILASSPIGQIGDTTVIVRNSSGEKVCEGCFRYLPPLKLDALEPNAGPIEGGSRVVLRGEGFTEDVTVLFGNRAGMDPELLGDGSLSVLVPPGDFPGLVDVRVFAPARQSLLRRAFRYRTELRIDGIEPPYAAIAGGDTVLLRGEGFTTSTRIRFGETEAFAQLREHGLEVVVPSALTPGAVRVEAYDQESSATFPFAYVDLADHTLALYAIVPERGPSVGGTEVTLIGSGLDGENLAVYFGDALAEDAVVEGPNLIRATAPAASPGSVEVRVRTADGMDSLPNAFQYLRPMEIAAVEPPSGPIEGGTRISLHGEGFPEEPIVYVGALRASDVVRVSDLRIDAVTPPGSDGAVPVWVLDAHDSTFHLIQRNAFRYEGPLSLAIVDPPSGARAGGTRVLVRGSGFRGEMKVFFGANESEEVNVLDPFTLEVYTPKGHVGLVDLRVEREDGEEAALEGAFNYFSPSSGFGGSAGGPLSGVLNVTAIARSGPNENAPVAGCTVFVGSDESAMLTKETDERGEVTFSSPSLVKAVSLTVACENYEIATVSNQVSESVTVLLDYNGPPPPPPDETGEDDPPVSFLGGTVHGFKLPPNRTLGPTEKAIARVSLAYANTYAAPPFGREMPVIDIPMEGGLFQFQIPFGGYFTVYAKYGILNTDPDSDPETEDATFEPLLLGHVRGITLPPDETINDIEIVLDTRLDQVVPVTILNPAWGTTESTEVTAYLDLGSDGLIPLSTAINVDAPDQAILENMPQVSGESLIFLALGDTFGAVPLSVAYRRQAGDVTQGVTIGPMLGQPTLLQPTLAIVGNQIVRKFNGTIEWTIEPSAEEPDVIYIDIYQPETLFSPRISEWHMVLPGDERRVTVPDAVRDALRAKLGDTPIRVDIIAGSQPTFDFPEWNYAGIGLASFTSFTYHAFMMVP